MGDDDLGASGSGRHGSRRIRPLAETWLHCLASMAATSPITIFRERVVSIQPQENHAAFVLANQAKILLRPFLGGYIEIGDEIAFPAPTEDTIRAEILITKNSNSCPNRYLYHVPIGYVSQPKQDKRNQHFVSAEVQPGSLGIGTVFLPCEVLREYFYRLQRGADSVDHPTLYEVLRIPASASPSELRVAFKLRDLERQTAGVRQRERLALERAFNIVGQPELRACYDALLADPEAPAIFPYGGFGSLLVAGEPSRDGQTFFARRILAFSPDLRRRRFHVPLRRCDFYDDRALCRDMRRKLELWLDPAALHTLWDRTWNQWKHLLGSKIEVEGTFVQSGKYRRRREQWELITWETALPSRLQVDRARIPAFDACRGRVPGRRRNHIDAAAHGIAVAGDRVKTRRCGGQRTSFRHGKARRQQEESRIRHTEIRQELLGRPAAPHSKRAVQVDRRC